MYYKSVIFSICLLWGSAMFAQNLDVQITQGPVYTLTTARVQNDYILPDQKGGFITISTKRSGFLADPLTLESYVMHFDSEMNLLNKKRFKLNNGAVKSDIKGAFIKEGRLHLIKLEKNLRQKSYTFKHLEGYIDKGLIMTDSTFFKLDFMYPKTSVNLIVNPNSLFSRKMKYYTDVNYFSPKIWIVFSQNNRFFAFIYRDPKLIPNSYHIQVFNQNFESLYNNQISPGVLSDNFKIDDIAVSDNNADVYLVTHIFKKHFSKKQSLSAFDNTKNIKIYRITAHDIDTYSIKPKAVLDKMHLHLSNQVTVFGFYHTNPSDLNQVDGIYRLDLSAGLGLLKQSYNLFKHQLLQSKSTVLSKKVKNHWMLIRKHFLLSDGSLLLNAEDLYVPLVLKKKHREEDVREFASNIFIFKVAPDGTINWLRQIEKEQIVKPRLATHSFFTTMIGNSNFIALSDSLIDLKDITNKKSGASANHRNLLGLKIDLNGTTNSSILWQEKRNKFLFIPLEGTMITPTIAIIPAKNHNYIKYFKLQFN